MHDIASLLVDYNDPQWLFVAKDNEDRPFFYFKRFLAPICPWYIRLECNLFVVTGPTASGKTRRAVALAREFGGDYQR